MVNIKTKKYVPSQGDIIVVDLNPVKGREQKGFRPALVISPSIYNSASELCLILPITSHAKGYPFEYQLEESLKTKGVILCDQIRNISHVNRKVKFIEKVSGEFLENVKNLTKTLIK